MEILYHDKDIVVCIKPPRVLSTDEPGGLPELVRKALGEDNIRTVHRLDRAVGGLMVLAKRKSAAARLSQQIREGTFEKEYVAVVHGSPQGGIFRDHLHRDKARKMSFLVPEGTADAQEAILEYTPEISGEELSRVRIRLITGRTHQIRAQFSGHGYPLVGDKKYGKAEECEIALWSTLLRFRHPYTGQPLTFSREPPEDYPWTELR